LGLVKYGWGKGIGGEGGWDGGKARGVWGQSSPEAEEFVK